MKPVLIMQRFTWAEMQVYWRGHSARWADIEVGRDPDGLGNACHVGAPLWLNRYYAHFQQVVFKRLLRFVPPPAPGARALDIGCGAGRWCRLLAAQGYATVGIDLQPELIELNRRRYPQVTFVCTSIQDYVRPAPFDLVTSVTVLQHLPFEQHTLTIQKLRAMLKPGGYALILENVRDQGPHLFSRSLQDWQAQFAQAGFTLVALQRYDYSPFLRVYGWLTRWVAARRHSAAGEDGTLTPEIFLEHLAGGGGWRRFGYLVKSAAVIPDAILEAALVQVGPALPTVHCGFLFQAR